MLQNLSSAAVVIGALRVNIKGHKVYSIGHHEVQYSETCVDWHKSFTIYMYNACNSIKIKIGAAVV